MEIVERLRDKFEAEDRVLNLGVDQSILSISELLYSFDAGDIVYKQELALSRFLMSALDTCQAKRTQRASSNTE